MNYQLNNQTQVLINCADLPAEMNFFIGLGFKIQQVLPADEPRMVLLAAYGLHLKLLQSNASSAVQLLLPATLTHLNLPVQSPSGVKLDVQKPMLNTCQLPDDISLTINQFKAAESWVTGRAGMRYRDLIVDRLGGAIIASNILIPEGGPVPDHVHYHDIEFQLIFCVEGWVKVVYEDQGEAFILEAGDCVTQPPAIRHQVLESSDGLEVVEIGLPAEHMTTLDYELSLPTDQPCPDREFAGQTFCHHQHSQASWQPWQHPHLLRCQTAVADHSRGLAAVNVIKAQCDFDDPVEVTHEDLLRFYYLRAGQLQLTDSQGQLTQLSARDSWVLPPQEAVQWRQISEDLNCIEFVLLKTKACT